MTREQIIKNLEYLIQFLPGKSIYAGETLTCAIDALRGPQPDPITGLVPCGCGHPLQLIRGEFEDLPDKVVDCWARCPNPDCGIELFATCSQSDIVEKTNRAMGYKGGAE